MANATIKITQLPNIGNGLTASTILPVVNTTGTAVTDKTTLGNIANLILTQAGNTLPPAFVANLAYTVVNSAQPNITRVGNLNINTLHISGGTNGYVLQTDGAGNLTWTAQTGGGGGNGTPGGANTQVQFNDAGSFGGEGNFTYDSANHILNVTRANSSFLTAYESVSTANLSANGIANIARINITNTANLGAVGNVTITGGSSGQKLTTDGAGHLSWTNDANSNYGNSNVASFLAAYGSNTISTTGNVKTGTLTVPASDNGSIVFSNNGTDTNGSLKVDGGYNMVISANSNFYVKRAGSDRLAITDTNTDLMASSNVVIHANKAGTEKNWTFDTTGKLTNPGNVLVDGQSLFVGEGSDIQGFTSETLVIYHQGEQYVQAALVNAADTGSADWVAYGHNGDDTGGWSDMGFTGISFNDPGYTITGSGDGYIFVQGFQDNQTGGNFVLATGSQGTTKDIVFATGGFAAENEFARIEDANSLLHITRTGGGIQFPDGSIQTTAGGGSANTGNVTFDNQIVIGTGDSGGFGGLYLAPGNTEQLANNGYFRVRGGDVATHLHFDTGDNTSFDQYFGDDNKYLKLELGSTGNVVIGTYNGDGYERWTFDSTGNLTVPGDIKSVTTGFSFTSNVTDVDTTTTAGAVYILLEDTEFGGPETGQVTITDVVGTTEVNGTWYFQAVEADQIQLYYDQALDYPVDGTGWPAYVSGGLAVAAGYNDLSITGGNVSIINNNGNTLVFDNTGVLTVPGNITLASGGKIGYAGMGWTGLLGANTGTPVEITSFTNAGNTSSQLFLNNNGSLVLFTADEGNATSYSWNYNSNGSLSMPGIGLGTGLDEQTIIQSQRKIIPAFHYSAIINGSTPTVVYTASSSNISSLKMTISITHGGLGQEMFDISAISAGANVLYSVSNRLNGTGQPDTTVSVDYAGGGPVYLAVTLTVNSGATTSWVTYDSTEFGYQVD